MCAHSKGCLHGELCFLFAALLCALCGPGRMFCYFRWNTLQRQRPHATDSGNKDGAVHHRWAARVASGEHLMPVDSVWPKSAVICDTVHAGRVTAEANLPPWLLQAKHTHANKSSLTAGRPRRRAPYAMHYEKRAFTANSWES